MEIKEFVIMANDSVVTCMQELLFAKVNESDCLCSFLEDKYTCYNHILRFFLSKSYISSPVTKKYVLQTLLEIKSNDDYEVGFELFPFSFFDSKSTVEEISAVFANMVPVEYFFSCKKIIYDIFNKYDTVFHKQLVHVIIPGLYTEREVSLDKQMNKGQLIRLAISHSTKLTYIYPISVFFGSFLVIMFLNKPLDLFAVIGSLVFAVLNAFISYFIFRILSCEFVIDKLNKK